MPKKATLPRERCLEAHNTLMSRLEEGSPEKAGILSAMVFAIANECGWNNEKLAEVFERYAERYR